MPMKSFLPFLFLLSCAFGQSITPTPDQTEIVTTQPDNLETIKQNSFESDEASQKIIDAIMAQDTSFKKIYVRGVTYFYKDPKPEMKKEVEVLEKIKQKWMKKFYMEKWNVVLQIISSDQLQEICPYEVKYCMASSSWDVHEKTGIIFVIRKQDYTNQMKDDLKKDHSTVKADQRNSVVHEMVHNIWNHMPEETAVQLLTGLLHP